MAHQSLYRAYRPHTFADVVGQEQVTKPLEEAVRAKKIGHAYLFAGSRGLGKTSVARILAKEIGCSERDLYEIDAASNNSVEDIRALTEGVYTLPFESPYKVYILDEVHMLSKSAWNAFLKTLEEPPAHAVFILATTELDRVPETVQSRCQVFEFKKPNRKALAELVTEVAKEEGYKLDLDAAELIAMLAENSYRDALSVLQKVLFKDANWKENFKAIGEKVIEPEPGRISRAWVEIYTGAPKREAVVNFLYALSSKNRAIALTIIESGAKDGLDLRLFLEMILEDLRRLLLIRYAPDLHQTIESELGHAEFLKYVEFSKEQGITPAVLLAFLNASERIRYAPIPALPLELAVLDVIPEA